jgi:CxxC motif-containing protein (DUF1111 family)
MGHPSKVISVLVDLTSAYTPRRVALAPAIFAAAVLGFGCGTAGPAGQTAGGSGSESTTPGGSGSPTSGGSGQTTTSGSVGGTGSASPGGSGSTTSGSVGGTGSVSPGDDGGSTFAASGSPGTLMTSTPACVATGGTGPALPASFALVCSGCHSAFGAAGNPEVPNLFTMAGGGSTCVTGTANSPVCTPVTAISAAQFLAQVRAPTALPGAPAGATVMPGFPTTAISDADVTSIYNYFKAGTPAPTATCPGANGTVSANVGVCQSKAATFSPLFVPTMTAASPISYTDPTTKDIIFRGSGRVRFRHEMEVTYEIFHDHYFEDRTFGYILDDTLPSGGTTIGITYLPVANQYYSHQANAGGQQGGADLNIRAWKIYGGVDGNVFGTNAGGASNNVLPFGCSPDANAVTCDTQKYTYTVTRNDRANRAIEMGDQFQVEFGIFLSRYPSMSAGGVPASGLGPPVDTTHVRNILPLPGGCTLNGGPYTNGCYTQANYYSDSFRYVVGSGTLTPYNQDCTLSVLPSIQGTGADFPHPYDCSATGPVQQAVSAGKMPTRIGPDEAGWSGGVATIPYIRQRLDLFYSQLAPNMLLENSQNAVQGRRLFHMDYTAGQDIEINNDVSPAETALHQNMAGPLYNQVTCEGCHAHDNRGVAPAAGMPFDSITVKTSASNDPVKGPTPDPNYGRQLQNKALSGATAEGSGSFTYTPVTGAFKDGTAYTLQKPTTTFTGLSGAQPAGYSVRLARPLIGMGLLEAIPEADILAHADPEDCNGDGIKGVPNFVVDPEDGTTKLGRFGWKASKASVRHQVADALILDIGVTTSVFPKADCGTSETSCSSATKTQMTDSDLNELVTYMREVAVPPRRDLYDPNVIRGEALFAEIGCVNCHAPNQHTGPEHPFLELENQVIHPYTDLLLHDMGPDLSDNSQGEYQATATMWRTPPLWGIGLCDTVAAGYTEDVTLNPAPNQGPCHYLHDGRAGSLLEAILWHGGEAANAKASVLALGSADRTALLAFLGSL